MTSLIIGVAIALVLPLAAAVANTLVHRQRATAQMAGQRRIPAKLSVRGLIDEAIATILVFLGPIAALTPRSRSTVIPHRALLVVLHAPGLAAASWLLVRRLRRAGWRVRSQRTSLRAYDDADLDQIASAWLAESSDHAQITLLGIGAAGLLARQLATRDARFARVVTIATPHQGTLSKVLPSTLRPQSDYVARTAELDPQPRRFDAIALYSDGDAWLEPTTAAYYPGAFNLEVHDIGHLSMLFSKRVFGYVEENLAAPPPPEAR